MVLSSYIFRTSELFCKRSRWHTPLAGVTGDIPQMPLPVIENLEYGD